MSVDQGSDLALHPIAVVMGVWTLGTCRAGCCTRWYGANGRTIYGGDPPTPTVDEMLTWLDERGYGADMGAARNEDGGRDIYVYLSPFGSILRADEITGEGDSLFAALEGAVRKVAAA